jgi:hypothetical protein
MQNTIYALLAACLAMLATSGIVALASAPPAAAPLEFAAVVDADDEADDYISEFIDREYRKLMAEKRR